MTCLRWGFEVVVLVLLVLAAVPAALAQNGESWVASSGLSSNPCTRSAPCDTFATAQAKTNPGGEIDCVDTGYFGVITITQALIIDCSGTGAFAQSITVQAGNSDAVTIRNLSLAGGGVVGGAIVVISGQALHVENVNMTGYSSSCVYSNSAGPFTLTIDNATMSNCGGQGIFVASLPHSTSTTLANINNSRISNAGSYGVQADNGSRVMIRNSSIFASQVGVGQTNETGTNLGSVVTIIDSVVGSTGNALQSLSGDFILAFGNTFIGNTTALVPNAGLIYTGGDNIGSANNSNGTANGGVIAKF